MGSLFAGFGNADPAQAVIANLISWLFSDSKFADLTIECEGRKWAVHRAIICPQSEYFMNLCDGAFLEAGKKHVVLKEDSPAAVNAMLRFFYKGDYEGEMTAKPDSSELDLHVAVFITADKYGVSRLTRLATTKFKISAKADSVDFARIAESLWSTEEKPEELRSVVCSIIMDNQHLLKRNSNTGLSKVIRNTPALAAELCFAMAKPGVVKDLAECVDCGGHFPSSSLSATDDGLACALRRPPLDRPGGALRPSDPEVHRIVVCSQSTFFERAVEGGFAEATTGVVNLVEDDAFAVQALLQYLYSGDYQWQPTFSSPDGVENNPGPLAFAVAVYTIADKYGVAALMSLAMAKFKELIGTRWRSEDFVDAVEAVYGTSPEKNKEMRERLVEIVSKNYRAFKDGNAFGNCQAVFNFAPFIADVLDLRMSMRTMPAGSTAYVCPSVNCRKWVIMRTTEDQTVQKHCPHCGALWANTPVFGWLRG